MLSGLWVIPFKTHRFGVIRCRKPLDGWETSDFKMELSFPYVRFWVSRQAKTLQHLVPDVFGWILELFASTRSTFPTSTWFKWSFSALDFSLHGSFGSQANPPGPPDWKPQSGSPKWAWEVLTG